MTPKQLTLPALPDYSQPLTVAASQLVTTIAQANAAGFRAIALAVLPAGYRVSFQGIDLPNARRQPATELALTQTDTPTPLPSCNTFENFARVQVTNLAKSPCENIRIMA